MSRFWSFGPRWIAAIALLALVSGCGASRAREPDWPLKLPPRADEAQAPKGKAMVIIDSDRPARVYMGPLEAPTRRTMPADALDYDIRRPLVCDSTPCIAYLSRGSYNLIFTDHRDSSKRSTGDVRVNGWRVAVQHRLGQREQTVPIAGLVMQGIGAAMLTATTIYAASNFQRDPDTGRQSLAPAARMFTQHGLVAGTAFFVPGTLLAVFGGGFRHQEGSTRQWNPPGSWSAKGARERHF